jgi:hypothetical protein
MSTGVTNSISSTPSMRNASTVLAISLLQAGVRGEANAKTKT